MPVKTLDAYPNFAQKDKLKKKKKNPQEQNADCYRELFMRAEIVPNASTTSIHKTELLEHVSLPEHSLKSQEKKK